MLERRLDNVVYRIGLAHNRAQARQLVRHGHFQVNGRTVDIPSFLVKVGDTVAVRDKSKKLVVVQSAVESRKGQSPPDWIEVNSDVLSGRVLSIPSRQSIPTPINEQLIVELYSK
jgi:small subunit ribosomal protein S4